MIRHRALVRAVILIAVSLSATGLPAQSAPVQPSAASQATTYTLTVQLAGNATGTVTSSPVGISCPSTCSASFDSGTSVKLTAVAAKGDYFAGWSGACKGTGTCTLTMNANKSATATFNVNQTVKVLNHIIFMAQENRGLDHYFGALRSYWKNNGFADRSFDGLPQFNPTSGPRPALRTAAHQSWLRSRISTAQ